MFSNWTLLDVAIMVFMVLESANVCILYFAPDSNRGNGVAVFKHWEASKANDDTHLFARYMTNWVAGTKLIFIVLLGVILITATETTKLWAVVVMLLSIGTYFWRLHPIMKLLDQRGQVKPSGYSKTLGAMIIGFELMFCTALLLHLWLR